MKTAIPTTKRKPRKASKKMAAWEKFQAAYRLLEDTEQGTEQSVRKRYRLTERQLKTAVSHFKRGVFKRDGYWDASWDHPDVIHHVIDRTTMVDILNGNAKGSDCDLLLDPCFDMENGLYHMRWSESDVEKLLAEIPYRALELLRDSTPGEECYEEAVLFLDSDAMRAICKKFGLDQEYILRAALEITKANF